MLCAAARIGAHMNEENIAVVRHIAEEVGLRFDDLREVGLELIGIVLCATPDDNLMWLAVDLELQQIMKADFQRRIDEDVVIRREQFARIARHAFQTCRDFPGCRGFDVDQDRILQAVRNMNENRRTGQKCMRVVHVPRAIP